MTKTNLTKAQRAALELWAERTKPGKWNHPRDVFPNQGPVDDSRRRAVCVLAGRGILEQGERGAIMGGNPFAPGPTPTAGGPIFPGPQPSAGPAAEPTPAPELTGPDHPDAVRIYTHMTRTTWLHMEDALEIGKVRLFAGQYKRGQGAQATAHHFLDLPDLRVLCLDLATGAPVDYCEFKGSPRGESGPTSRVLKVKSNGSGKVWVRLENGPGTVIGEGAVKPAGDPAAVVNVPLTTYQARRLAVTVQAYLNAAQVVALQG